MSNGEILQEYSNSIKNIKKQCRDAGMSEDEFKRMYFQSLKTLRSPGENGASPRRYVNTKYIILCIGIISGFFVMYNYKTMYSTVMCNVQEYIYPGLKLLRRISIPFISLFPSLTDFYHETCLIQNPFFMVVDMDCWPCSAVTNVIEVYDPDPVSQQHTAPFIYENLKNKTNNILVLFTSEETLGEKKVDEFPKIITDVTTEQKAINMESLNQMYIRNRDIFNRESPKVLLNNKYYQTPDYLFDQRLSDDRNLYIWKFNNIKVAHLLRQVIARPKVVPKFGQSTERFIVVDKSQSLFRVPDTECSFSFLLALSGSREIHLLPAEECIHQCKPLKVQLKETYLLWYNWWYWRPAVQPSMGNETFIAHVGSYC